MPTSIEPMVVVADGPGAGDGRHAQHVGGGDRPDPAAGGLRVGGQAHGQPRVEVVGRRRAVGAEGDGHAGGEEVGDPGEAAAELLVRRRAVGDGRPAGGDERRGRRRRGARRGRARVPGPSSPVSREHLDRRAAVARADGGQLGGGLAGVDVDAAPRRRRELADGARAGPRRAGTCCAGRPSAGPAAWRSSSSAAHAMRSSKGRPSAPGNSTNTGPPRRSNPAAAATAAAASGKKYMSSAVVIPARRHSATASAVPAATVAADSTAPSAGSRRARKPSRSRSSARPRNIVIARWVWALTSPGTTIAPRASIDPVGRRRLVRGRTMPVIEPAVDEHRGARRGRCRPRPS